MFKRNRIISFDERRQIAGESHTGHLRPVALFIVRAPAGLDGVQISGVDRWAQEPMSPVDSRVQKTYAGRFIGLGSELCSCKQLVEPLLLLFPPQRIEELGGLLRAPKLRDAVERQHRMLHLLS